MLAIGAAALDCPHVLGVDVDDNALQAAACNLAKTLTYTHKKTPRLQGMLAIGAAALDCPHVLGVDVDADALQVAACNLAAIGEDLPVRCRTPSSAVSEPCAQPHLRSFACANTCLWGAAT